MRGNNHYADCGCEWCGNVGWNVDSWGGGGAGGGGAATYPTKLPVELDGEPEPNANCPECGQRVHFRQLDNGGRVFFDALGPLWPKHPCTDNSLDEGSRAIDATQQASISEDTPVDIADESTSAAGWTPVRFVSQKKGSRGDSPAHHLGWTTARARNLATSTWESWLVPEPLDVRRFDLAYRSEWGEDGQAVISYLLQVDRHSFVAFEAVVWSERRYAEIRSDLVLEAFSIDFGTRGRWALERYLNQVNWNLVYGNPSKEVLLDAIDEVVNEVRYSGWQDDKDHVAWMRKRVRETLDKHMLLGFRLLDPIMERVFAYY